MNRRSLSAAVPLALLAGLVLGACGGEDDPPPTPTEPPERLLREAFANPPASGEAAIDAEFVLEGDSLLEGPLTAFLAGPFAAAEDGGLPSFDMALDAEVAGFGLDGELVSTGEDAYVVFFGENYRAGPPAVAAFERSLATVQRSSGADSAELGAQLAGWFVKPRYEGAEEVAGTQTERISAELDSAAAVRYFGGIAAAALGDPGIPSLLGGSADAGTIDAWVASDDKTVRRLDVRFPFVVPAALVSRASGVTGGTASFRVEISDVGAEVEVEPPPGGAFKPLPRLIERLADLASLGL